MLTILLIYSIDIRKNTVKKKSVRKNSKSGKKFQNPENPENFFPNFPDFHFSGFGIIPK